MSSHLKIGDHVSWQSSQGTVKGIIEKIITADVLFMGKQYRASSENPHYLVKSEKTEKLAIHRANALKKL